MRKKLRDMVVGDVFTHPAVGSGLKYTIKGVCHDHSTVMHENMDEPVVWMHSLYATTFLDLVEPEPEWLYECVDRKNQVLFVSIDDRICDFGFKVIKGGRRMHPDTHEIK